MGINDIIRSIVGSLQCMIYTPLHMKFLTHAFYNASDMIYHIRSIISYPRCFWWYHLYFCVKCLHSLIIITKRIDGIILCLPSFTISDKIFLQQINCKAVLLITYVISVWEITNGLLRRLKQCYIRHYRVFFLRTTSCIYQTHVKTCL